MLFMNLAKTRLWMLVYAAFATFANTIDNIKKFNWGRKRGKLSSWLTWLLWLHVQVEAHFFLFSLEFCKLYIILDLFLNMGVTTFELVWIFPWQKLFFSVAESVAPAFRGWSHSFGHQNQRSWFKAVLGPMPQWLHPYFIYSLIVIWACNGQLTDLGNSSYLAQLKLQLRLNTIAVWLRFTTVKHLWNVNVLRQLNFPKPLSSP